jgi:serine O-acetyltransferase
MPDPVANAISAMLDHIQKLDEQMVRVCKVLHEVDSRMPELELQKLELPDFCKDADLGALDSLAAAMPKDRKTG